jgi:hypothetical protein
MILEKYKMLLKHKARMNILLYKMILMPIVRPALKIDVLKWNKPSILDITRVTRSFMCPH